MWSFIKKIFKEEKSSEILKILGFINNTEEDHKIYNDEFRLKK